MAAIPQRSFARGEISPAMQARADLVAYALGLKTCRNGFIRADGGWMNRGGSAMCEETKSSGEVRTIEWIFGESSQNCVLELGEGYIRVLVAGSFQTVTSPTAWDAGGMYFAGMIVSHEGVNYYAKQSSMGSEPPNADDWHAMPGDILEIPTPWTLEEVRQLYYSQNENLMLFFHGDHRVRELTCYGPEEWVLDFPGPVDTTQYFTPFPSLITGLAHDGAAGVGYTWWVAPIFKDTGTEGIAASVHSGADWGSADPRVLTWDANTYASGYLVYRTDGRGTGLLGFTELTTFSDFALDTDLTERPVQLNPTFTSSDATPLANFPKIGAFSKQRLFVANILGSFSTVLGSWIGDFRNFSRKAPITPNSSLHFSLKGKRGTSIKHLFDLGGLWILTDGGEYYCEGDGNGLITPGNPNPVQYSANGSSDLVPIEISKSVIYVQAQGGIIRELGFDVGAGGRNGYQDADLSLMARHLFEGRQIKSWAYQKTPDSIVWMAMSDGKLIGVTYVKEQQIIAFHQHETDGFVENVVAIPEGEEHVVYLVVRRTIDGATKRYHERMASRRFTDIRDAVFMDSALSYDGRNSDESHTLLLSGGTTWAAGEELNLESSETGYFSAGEVGNVYRLTGEDDDGNEIGLDLEVISFVDAENVTVRAERDIPAGMQDALTWEWARCVDQLSGLDHLEGKAVSILADGGVIASPNNSQYPAFTVESGGLSRTLGACYAVIHVGLPYISDLETLSLETLNNETMANKKAIVSQVTAYLQDSRGLYFGAKIPEGSDPLGGMEEMRPVIEGYNEPATLQTGKVTIPIQGSWTKDGKCAARQVDPLPATINAIVPTGLIPA